MLEILLFSNLIYKPNRCTKNLKIMNIIPHTYLTIIIDV